MVTAAPLTRPAPVTRWTDDDRVWAAAHRDRLATSASAVTAVRTVVCVALCGLAAGGGYGSGARALLLAALAVHWVGDIADGAVARRRGEETVTGAVLDISADRLCVCAVYLGYVATAPWFALPVTIYLLEFAFVDTVLSLAFVRFGLISPNYFDRVDPTVWRWNWWQPAKALNSALVAVLCVVFGLPWVGVAVASVLLVVKTACLVRVGRRLSREPAEPVVARAGRTGA